MALTKRQYTDGQTIVTAANLNEIQDHLIDVENAYVPKTRKVAGKALTSDITLAASDVGAVPTGRTVNSKALSSNITLSAADVGAAPTNHASTATTYGKGTSTNYGHVKISDSLTDTTTAATGGVVPSMKAVSDLKGALSDEATARENADSALQGAITNKMFIKSGTISSAHTSAATTTLATDTAKINASTDIANVWFSNPSLITSNYTIATNANGQVTINCTNSAQVTVYVVLFNP